MWGLLELNWDYQLPNHTILHLTNIPKIEWLALHDLYQETDGENWSWSQETDKYGRKWNFTGGNNVHNPCSEKWQYIECSCLLQEGINAIHSTTSTLAEGDGASEFYYGYAEEDAPVHNDTTIGCSITKLHMIGVGLRGTLPASFSNLVNLTHIHLDTNELSGQIDTILSPLHRLRTLSISSNFFSGPFPLQSPFPELSFLSLTENHFFGTIPNELRIPSLIYFDIGDNNLYGSFPELMLSNCQKLRIFRVASNLFTGTIPSFLNNCSHLLLFDALQTKFTGTFPEQIITESLLSFNLGSSELFGDLDEFVAHIEKTFHPSTKQSPLNQFDLESSNIHGKLPSSNFWNVFFPLLSDFSVRENEFTGSIPIDFCSSHELVSFTIVDNYFTGTLPECLIDLPDVTYLALTGNHLTGTISCSWFSMKYLEAIEFGGNRLTGKLFDCHQPSIHDNRLDVIRIDQNHLSGPIPLSILFGDSLSMLILSHNLFSKFSKWEDYQLLYPNRKNKNNNDTALEIIDISKNPINDGFPLEWLSFLSNLKGFFSAGTCLFPDDQAIGVKDALREFCVSTPNLTALSLDGTKASCTDLRALIPKKTQNIPSCLFTDLLRLERITLSSSGIQKHLPNISSLSSSLKTFVASYNKLSGTIPNEFQQHSWTMLDLSFNKIQGGLLNTATYYYYHPSNRSNNNLMTISKEKQENLTQTSIILESNRLSETIPLVYTTSKWKKLSILQGNLFSCSIDQHELPPDDNGSITYSCGSNSINVTLYIWIFMTFLLFLVSFLRSVYLIEEKGNYEKAIELIIEKYFFAWSWIPFFLCRQGNHSNNNNNPFQSMQKAARKSLSMHVFHKKTSLACSEIFQEVYQMMKDITQLITKLLLILLILLIPLYCILGSFFKTHENTYAYLVSGAYLTGSIPATFLGFCWLLISILLFQTNVKFSEFKSTRERSFSASFSSKKNKKQRNDRENNNSSTKSSRISPLKLILPAAIGNYRNIQSTNNNNNNKNRDKEKDKEEEKEEEEITSAILWNISTFQKFYFSFLFISICLSVFIGIIGLNIGFLYTQINYNLSWRIFAQCAMSWMKLFLSSYVLPTLFATMVSHVYSQIIKNHENEANYLLLIAHKKELEELLRYGQLLLEICFGVIINVIAPCAATLLYDTNCFYYAALTHPPPVINTFHVTVCAEYLSPDQLNATAALSPSSSSGGVESSCIKDEMITLTSDYDLQFQYSFLCASSLLSNYCFVFVFMVLLDGTIKPIAKSFFLMVIGYCFPHVGAVTRVVEGEEEQQQQPEHELGEEGTKLRHRNNVKQLLYTGNEEKFLTFVVNYLAILCSFGIIFIPLGIMLAWHLLSVLVKEYHQLEDFFCRLNNLSSYQKLPKDWFASIDIESNLPQPQKKKNNNEKNEEDHVEQSPPLKMNDPRIQLVRQALLKISEGKVKHLVVGMRTLFLYLILPLQFIFCYFFVFDTLGDAVDWALATLVVGTALLVTGGLLSFIFVCSRFRIKLFTKPEETDDKDQIEDNLSEEEEGSSPISPTRLAPVQMTKINKSSGADDDDDDEEEDYRLPSSSTVTASPVKAIEIIHDDKNNDKNKDKGEEVRTDLIVLKNYHSESMSLKSFSEESDYDSDSFNPSELADSLPKRAIPSQSISSGGSYRLSTAKDDEEQLEEGEVRESSRDGAGGGQEEEGKEIRSSSEKQSSLQPPVLTIRVSPSSSPTLKGKSPKNLLSARRVLLLEPSPSSSPTNRNHLHHRNDHHHKKPPANQLLQMQLAAQSAELEKIIRLIEAEERASDVGIDMISAAVALVIAL